MPLRRLLLLAACLFVVSAAFGQSEPVRQRVTMDADWRFALGNAIDSSKDFHFDDGQSFFFSKAGHGNGPADPHFDDRAWQPVNLPHDWAVSLPFDRRGDGNHGSKAIGHDFPQNNIGWYRKTFDIPATAEGKRLRVDFDGVYRDSQVWFNGFYLGTEHSGYSSFGYDITDYVNYGAANTLVVRADASQEEGWFYEGAGIYRHVWLTETSQIHVATDGAFVTTEIADPLAPHPGATVSARFDIENDTEVAAKVQLEGEIVDSAGKVVATSGPVNGVAVVGQPTQGSLRFQVADAHLWSLEDPTLYKVVATIRSDGKIVDRYEVPFGIRKIEWTADKGFFLNGKHVEIKGTNDHQDAAGVGIGIPDDVNVFRLERLKALGSNAIRTSHNPATPELLNAADRLGMLILEENRMMGTTPEDEDQLTRMIRRDRNHPSIVLWSLGNEEWSLEWSVYGTRLAQSLTALAHRLDPTRRSTIAMSGSGQGISLAVDVFGFNYFLQHHIDEMHKRFPDRPSVGTEESSSEHTRGMYFDDPAHQHLTGFDFEADGKHASIEEGWRFYMERPYAAGLFYWTGFDYRGETTPFGWPAISSQFGLLDTCGFMKDTAFAAQSFWSATPMVHLATTWTLPSTVQHGASGQPVAVLVYSNAAAVELFLNGKSLGRKKVPEYSHLEWQVPYAPGALTARGYNKAGAEVAHDTVETTSAPAKVYLDGTTDQIADDGTSVSVVTVRVEDANGRPVPDASNLISFSLSGPGRILGVGNGDPSSHEPDQYLPVYSSIGVTNWRTKAVSSVSAGPEIAPAFDDSSWEPARDPHWDEKPNPPAASVIRGEFVIPPGTLTASFELLLRPYGDDESVYLNGHKLKPVHDQIVLDPALLIPGKNTLTLYAKHSDKQQSWDWYHGGPATISMVTAAAQWQRSVFNGLAQILVQSTTQPGRISLTATSPGLTPATVTIVSTLPQR